MIICDRGGVALWLCYLWRSLPDDNTQEQISSIIIFALSNGSEIWIATTIADSHDYQTSSRAFRETLEAVLKIIVTEPPSQH